jgi:hypothetical protein
MSLPFDIKGRWGGREDQAKQTEFIHVLVYLSSSSVRVDLSPELLQFLPLH